MNTTSITLNNTGIVLKRFYKVPRGFELPFAGRWLKAVGHHPGCINFVAAGGNRVSLGNASAALLAQHADATQATSPKSFN
jgi:hypothetical protein